MMKIVIFIDRIVIIVSIFIAIIIIFILFLNRSNFIHKFN